MIGSRATVDPIAKQVRRAQEEGWTYSGDMSTEGEVIDLLYALARIMKPAIAVETGTYNGHGTIALSEALKVNGRGHLWTIEKEDYTYPPMDKVTFIHGDSTDWTPPSPIDFAWVDCGPPEVRIKAFELLLPKLAKKHVIAAHDTWFYTDEFKDALSKAYGRAPDLDLKALNGVVVWIEQ